MSPPQEATGLVPRAEQNGNNSHRQPAKPQMRVLMVFSALGVGGAETWLMALLEYFKSHADELPVDLQVDICLTSGVRATFDDRAKELGARLFYLPYTRRRLPVFVRGFRRILAQGRYHAIHDHQDYTAGLHFLFGTGVLPHVRIAHVHNTPTSLDYFFSNPLRRAILLSGKWLLAGFATHVMGTSRQVVSEYGFDHRAFRNLILGTAHCGFDVANFHSNRVMKHRELCHEFGWDEDSRILLFVGRLDSNMNQKNPAFALEVARDCIRRNTSVRLLVVGGGEREKEKLESQVACWGIQEHISFLGARHDISRLMAGADLLLFPSLGEGLGMVAVESQAAALRVLASDAVPRECAVVPDMVRFLPLSAGAPSWAEVALQLLHDPRLDPLACNRAVAQSAFSIENSAHRLLQLYGVGAMNEKTLSSVS